MAEDNDQKQIVQQKFMEFQQQREQIKQLNEHLEQLNKKVEEITQIIGNVKEISDTEEGTEILVPISNGIFIKAQTKDTKDFLVNVGAKTVVKKDYEGVKGLLDKQKVEMIELQQQMQEDIDKVETEAVKLQEELQTMIGE